MTHIALLVSLHLGQKKKKLSRWAVCWRILCRGSQYIPTALHQLWTNCSSRIQCSNWNAFGNSSFLVNKSASLGKINKGCSSKGHSETVDYSSKPHYIWIMSVSFWVNKVDGLKCIFKLSVFCPLPLNIFSVRGHRHIIVYIHMSWLT